MSKFDLVSPTDTESLSVAGEPSSPIFRGPSHDYGGQSQQTSHAGLTFENTMRIAATGGGTRSSEPVSDADVDIVARHDPVPPYTALPGPGEECIAEAEQGDGRDVPPPYTLAQHPQADALREAANCSPMMKDTATTAARVAMRRAGEQALKTAQPRKDLAAAAARTALRRIQP